MCQLVVVRKGVPTYLLEVSRDAEALDQVVVVLNEPLRNDRLG